METAKSHSQKPGLLQPTQVISFYQFDACRAHKSTIDHVVVSTDAGLPELHFVSPKEDVYECSSLVVFAGNKKRTSLWWKNGLTEVQLSRPSTFGGEGNLQFIHTPILWEKLVEGREIFLQQEGCGQQIPALDSRLAIGGLGVRTVQPLPKRLRTPAFIDAEVFDEAKTLKVKNVLPGAMVRITVDDVPYGQKEALEDVVEVPLTGPKFPGGAPLRAVQNISVMQVFECGPRRKPSSEKASRTVMQTGWFPDGN